MLRSVEPRTAPAQQLTVEYEKFRAALEASPVVVFTQDLDLRYTWIENPALGYEAQGVVGKCDADLFERAEDVRRLERLKRLALERGEAVRETVPILSEGVVRSYDVRVSPERLKGEVIGVLGTALDVTEHVEAIRKHQTLLDECAHRIRNLLVVIQLIAKRSLTGRRKLAEELDAFDQRLRALSHTNDALVRQSEAVTLHEIVRRHTAAFEDRSDAEGPAIAIRPEAAQMFSLISHELATNAAKYGALSHAAGLLRIRWNVSAADPEPRFRFEWRESGLSGVRSPSRQGFGSTLLVKMAAKEFACVPQLAFEDQGVRYSLEAPLERVGRLIET